MCWPVRCILYIIVDIVNLLETRNELRPSHEPIVATLGSSLIFPRRSITPTQLPTTDTGLDTRDTIEGRPNVETEHRVAIGEGRVE